MTDDQGIGTILNDTDTATITIDDVTQSEDGGNATFTCIIGQSGIDGTSP